MNETYRVRMIVQTLEHGELTGDWSEPLTAEQDREARDLTKDNWDDLRCLSLTMSEREIIIPAEVFHQSVIIFEKINNDDYEHNLGA